MLCICLNCFYGLPSEWLSQFFHGCSLVLLLQSHRNLLPNKRYSRLRLLCLPWLGRCSQYPAKSYRPYLQIFGDSIDLQNNTVSDQARFSCGISRTNEPNAVKLIMFIIYAISNSIIAYRHKSHPG